MKLKKGIYDERKRVKEEIITTSMKKRCNKLKAGEN